MKSIDATGLSCPQPVLLAKQGLSSSPEGIDITVDNATAEQNITRFAKNIGYSVESTNDGELFKLAIRKK